MEELFGAFDLRDDVIQEEIEVNDMEKLVFYRYPPEKDSTYSDIALFLAEITFHFLNDNMMFSAITPSFYLVEFNNVPPVEELMRFITVEEIKEVKP